MGVGNGGARSWRSSFPTLLRSATDREDQEFNRKKSVTLKQALKYWQQSMRYSRKVSRVESLIVPTQAFNPHLS